MLNKIVSLLLILLSISCSENDFTPKPDVDEKYFRAFKMSNPYSKILHDSFNNLIIVMDRSEGRIKSYDYLNHTVIAATDKDFFVFGNELCLYATQGKSELYLANDKTIFTYDAFTLEVIDSMEVFGSTDIRFINSIVAPNDNILIIGACNTGSHNGKEGSITINKETKSIIDQAEYGGNCLRLREFEPSPGVVGIIGVSFPRVVYDIYTENGVLVENNINFSVPNISAHILKVPNESDYFVTSKEGYIFRKTDQELIQSLNGNYNDIVISNDEKTLYGVSKNEKIEIFEYEDSLTFTFKEIIPLENIPERAFIANNKLIVVYFVSTSPSPLIKDDVYLSILDI